MKVRMMDGEERDVDDARAHELVNTGAAKVDDPNAVVEVPSTLVAEQEARLAYAETEYATPQEKRQAALERKGLEDGSHARLHQTDLPALAVPDEGHAASLELDGDELFKNKGPVDARPDSAGYSGLPDSTLGEAVTPLSGPAKDVEQGSVQAPDVQAAAQKAQAKQQTADKQQQSGDRQDVSPSSTAPAKAQASKGDK